MHTLRRMAGRLLLGLASIYCIGIVILALLWFARIHGHWWLELANIFALYLCTPILVLAPLTWLVDARWLRGSAALALVAFFALFGARLIPPAAPSSVGTPLRVATLNLHYGLQQPQLAASIVAIRAQHADVVALQELSLPAAAMFQRDLIGEYPFQALAPSETFTGMGLLSRYPLELLQGSPDLTAQLAQVRLGNAQVALINVSLSSPEIKRRYLPVVGWVKGIGGYRTKKRTRDVEQQLSLIAQVRGPLVVVGDFNLSDREPEYDQLTAQLHDGYRETS